MTPLPHRPHTWIDLAMAAGAPVEEADYLLWNASAFPFDSPREVYRQLQHSIRHKECIDPIAVRERIEEEWEAAHADSIALLPLPLRRGDPTECWPRRRDR